MKKRILMVLLVMALLVTAAVFTVQAANGTESFDINTFACPCSACKDQAGQAEWKTNLEKSGNAIKAGHYYLTSNVELTAQHTIAGNVVIVLHNATITSVTTEYRAMRVATHSLDLIGVGEAKFLVDTANASSAFQLDSSAVVNLRGTLEIDMADTCDTAYTNGIFKLATATLNMYDDVVLNALPMTDAGLGGAVWIQSGGNSAFNMYGGIINAGRTVKQGGGVYAATGTVKLAGGQIIVPADGNTATAGRAVFTSTGATLNIQPGATVTDSGIDTVSTIYAGGAANISGGKVTGKIVTGETATVTLSGAPAIKGTGLVLDGGVLLSLGALTADAGINITAADGMKISATSADAETYAKYFNSTSVGRSVIAKGKEGEKALYVSTASEYAERMTFPTDGTEITQDCPACQASAKWVAVSATISGNHYLNDDSYGGATHFYFPSNPTVEGTDI